MAEITVVSSGNVNVASNYFPAQIPTALDTVIFGAYSMLVPGGYTWNPGAIEMTGTGDLTRASLTVQSGGQMHQAGVVTCNAYNHVRIEGTGLWDMKGNNVLLTVNTGTAVNNIHEMAGTDKSNHARIIDSVGGAHWGAAAGAAARAKLDWQHFTLKNMSFGLGGNWYAGHPVNTREGVFKDLYEWSLGSGYTNGEEQFIFNYVDVVGSNSASSQIGVIAAQKGNGAGGLHQSIGVTIDPQRHGMNLRIEYMDCERVGWVAKDILLGTMVQSNFYLNQCFVYFGPDSSWSAIGGGHFGLKDSVALVATNNPHTTEDFESVTGSFIDAPYTAAVINDAGDHCILPANADFELSNTIIVDELGGVALNALGAPHLGNYSANHNTLIVDVPDNTGRYYGVLARTESGGSYDGTLGLHNNLCFVRSNPNAYDDIMAINIDTAGNDQVTTMGNNAFIGFAVLAANRFNGVLSATKAIGAPGYGAGDIINVQPDFVDVNRNTASWQASQNGGGGAAEAIASALLVNGYNVATDDQSGTPSGFLASSIINYVRDGLVPTNIAYDGTASDGGTIGAVAYAANDSVAPVFSSPLSISSITSTSFNADFTIDEDSNVSALLTTIAAAQPSDTFFDESDDIIAATAATPATIPLSLLTQGTAYKVWLQAVDAALNRSVDSERVYLPRAGFNTVIVTIPSAVVEDRIESTPDIVSGLIIEWGNYVNCTSVTVNADATFSQTITDVEQVSSFDARIIDLLTGDISADVIQTTPAQTFIPVMPSDADISVNEEQSAVGTFAAISGTEPIVYDLLGVDAALFSINSSTGAVIFSSSPDFENPVDIGEDNVFNIGVRATNALGNAIQSVAITLLNVVEDTMVDEYSFTNVSGAALSTQVISDAITVAGIDGPVSISITNGEYRIDAGTWITTSGIVSAGDFVELRQTSSSVYETPVIATLNINGITANWRVTTLADVPAEQVVSIGGDSNIRAGEACVIETTGIDWTNIIQVTLSSGITEYALTVLGAGFVYIPTTVPTGSYTLILREFN